MLWLLMLNASWTACLERLTFLLVSIKPGTSKLLKIKSRSYLPTCSSNVAFLSLGNDATTSSPLIAASAASAFRVDSLMRNEVVLGSKSIDFLAADIEAFLSRPPLLEPFLELFLEPLPDFGFSDYYEFERVSLTYDGLIFPAICT